MNRNQIIGVVILLIIVGGGSYWAGKASASSSAAASGMQRAGAGGTFAGRGGNRAGGLNAVFGTIIAKDASSITVQLGGPNATSTNGGSTGTRIVLVGQSTQVGKFVQGSLSDLSTGEMVSVNGTPNSDGSVTASMVQIRPAGSGPRQGQ